MSTRCNIRFIKNGQTAANVYRHSDGYPDSECGVLSDLEKFFEAVKKEAPDTRFHDPEYLAAKFVVWQAGQNGTGLNFMGVGVCVKDHGDSQFIYQVNCDKNALNKPTVTYSKVER